MTMINETKFYKDRLTGLIPYMREELKKWNEGDHSDAVQYRLLKYNKMLCDNVKKLNGEVKDIKCLYIKSMIAIIEDNFNKISVMTKTKNGKYKFVLDMNQYYCEVIEE